MTELVEVHLLQLPVPLAAKAIQHFEELTREFALIAGGSASSDPAHQVPARLMELIDALVQRYGGLNTEAEERLAAAIDRGDVVIEDHVLDVPPEADEATRALGAMVDEADDYCRSGEHLLTLESPRDCVAYRRWYLGEVLAQLRGEPPTPWPDSAEARSLS